MTSLLSIAVVVVLVFIADGKRFRRDLSERSLPDTIHYMTTSDVDDVQCLFDTTPNCWKRAYVKDLVDDLQQIGEKYGELKTFNWFTVTVQELYKYEGELFEDMRKLLKLLPKSMVYHKDSQDVSYLFDQVLFPCLLEYSKIDFNDNTLVNFEAARQKAIQHFASCESDGFIKAKDALENICLIDARRSLESMKLILELLAEARDVNHRVISIMYLNASRYSFQPSDDWNTAFKIDALKTKHILSAGQALVDKFSEENTDGDGQDEVRRASLISEVVSNIEANEASEETSRKAKKTQLPLTRESVRKTVSPLRREQVRKAGYLSDKTKLKQQLAELLSNGRDFY